MNFPLSLWDIGLWLAIASIILLITSEMLSQRYGKINIRLNKRRLRNASLAVSTLFLATVALRVIDIIVTL